MWVWPRRNVQLTIELQKNRAGKSVGEAAQWQWEVTQEGKGHQVKRAPLRCESSIVDNVFGIEPKAEV